MNLIYRLEENLDCNKICKDIQDMLNVKMAQGELNNSVLSIGLSSLVDSQEKSQTLLLSHKDNNHDAGKNNN